MYFILLSSYLFYLNYLAKSFLKYQPVFIVLMEVQERFIESNIPQEGRCGHSGQPHLKDKA